MQTPKPITDEIASTADGHHVAGHYVGELVGAHNKLLRLSPLTQHLFHKILRDDQVQSCFEQRRRAVTSREWQVSPGGEDPRDEQAAEALSQQLGAIDWDATTDKMLYGLFYGHAVGEVLWAVRDGGVVIDDIKVRRASRFHFDEDGLRLTRSTGEVETMPDRKFWAFLTGRDNDDDLHGVGLAHWLYWPTLFRREGLRAWLIFLDRFGQPTAKGTYPSGASQETKEKLLQALRAISTDSGIAVPEGVQIDLVEAARSGTADYSTLFDAMGSSISKIVLSQTMTTDAGPAGLGSNQAGVHQDVKLEVVQGDSDLLYGAFNRTVARWWTEWNFPGARTPVVSRRVSEEEDQKTLAERDEIITRMGFRPTEEYIKRTYGEGFVPAPAGGGGLGQVPSFAEGDLGASGSLDRVLQAADSFDFQALAEPLIRPLLKAAEERPDSVLAALQQLLPDLDEEALQDRLTQILFIAEGIGRLEALDD